MKIKLNIKPSYLALVVICITVIIVAIVSVKSINKNNNQNTSAIEQIVQNHYITTQTKLDGINDGLGTINDGLGTINENVKVVDGKVDALVGKVDALSAELGLVKEDIDLIQEDLISLGLTIEELQQATLIELEGLKSTLIDIRKQGYSNVTAKKLISYNRCESSNRSNCHFLLD